MVLTGKEVTEVVKVLTDGSEDSSEEMGESLDNQADRDSSDIVV